MKLGIAGAYVNPTVPRNSVRKLSQEFRTHLSYLGGNKETRAYGKRMLGQIMLSMTPEDRRLANIAIKKFEKQNIIVIA
jgi:hypothetical protein